MTKKQTAVEWLVNFFEDYYALVPVDIIEQAKAMEKQQIENAYWDGGEDMPMISKQCEQYYNEKFEA
jgi:hypothetical protein